MCLVCHYSIGTLPGELDVNSDEAQGIIALGHEDMDPRCFRPVGVTEFFLRCVDCGEEFENTKKQEENHCCYD